MSDTLFGVDYDAPAALPPAVVTSPTSVAASKAIVRRSGSQSSLVLLAIRNAGDRGLTDEEGIEATRLSPSSYRPRRTELVAKGLVVDSTRTRPAASGRSAVVWVAAWGR